MPRIAEVGFMNDEGTGAELLSVDGAGFLCRQMGWVGSEYLGT